MTAEVRDVRRIGGGHGLRGGQEKEWIGLFPGRPQRFRYQHRSVNDCSPEREGGVQDGGTRGGSSMVKCVALVKVRAGLRHSIVCPRT